MKKTRTVKKTFEEQLGGRRGRGRPKLGWIYDVEEDVRNMGIKRWRIKVSYRAEWASIIKEAKAKLKVLYCYKKKKKKNVNCIIVLCLIIHIRSV
jgi:hypothetical protein